MSDDSFFMEESKNESKSKIKDSFFWFLNLTSYYFIKTIISINSKED